MILELRTWIRLKNSEQYSRRKQIFEIERRMEPPAFLPEFLDRGHIALLMSSEQ